MSFFAFLPAICAAIVTIVALSSIYDKNDEMVWRIWKLIFGIIVFIFTCYLFKLGLDDVHKTYIYTSPRYGGAGIY